MTATFGWGLMGSKTQLPPCHVGLQCLSLFNSMGEFVVNWLDYDEVLQQLLNRTCLNTLSQVVHHYFPHILFFTLMHTWSLGVEWGNASALLQKLRLQLVLVTPVQLQEEVILLKGCVWVDGNGLFYIVSMSACTYTSILLRKTKQKKS